MSTGAGVPAAILDQSFKRPVDALALRQSAWLSPAPEDPLNATAPRGAAWGGSERALVAMCDWVWAVSGQTGTFREGNSIRDGERSERKGEKEGRDAP